MLLQGDIAGDEDAEMSDRVMEGVNDGLAVSDNFINVVVEVENPVERLVGGRDVVAPRTETDDRRLDVSEVDPESVGGANLAGRKLVADEQIVDDPLHFPGVGENRTAPPGLEREETLLLRVDL